MAQRGMNLTSTHEDTGSIPGLTEWVSGSGIAVSCGVGRRYGLYPVLLWLWCTLAATAPIGPLAWEPTYATSAALKRPGKKIILNMPLKGLARTVPEQRRLWPERASWPGGGCKPPSLSGLRGHSSSRAEAQALGGQGGLQPPTSNRNLGPRTLHDRDDLASHGPGLDPPRTYPATRVPGLWHSALTLALALTLTVSGALFLLSGLRKPNRVRDRVHQPGSGLEQVSTCRGHRWAGLGVTHSLVWSPCQRLSSHWKGLEGAGGRRPAGSRLGLQAGPSRGIHSEVWGLPGVLLNGKLKTGGTPRVSGSRDDKPMLSPPSSLTQDGGP